MVWSVEDSAYTMESWVLFCDLCYKRRTLIWLDFGSVPTLMADFSSGHLWYLFAAWHDQSVSRVGVNCCYTSEESVAGWSICQTQACWCSLPIHPDSCSCSTAWTWWELQDCTTFLASTSSKITHLNFSHFCIWGGLPWLVWQCTYNGWPLQFVLQTVNSHEDPDYPFLALILIPTGDSK
jgi:hypothetical protein